MTHRFVGRVASVLAACTGWLGALAAMAQPVVTSYQEDGQLIRGRMQPATLGPQLFGDSVSLYTGALEFTQVDVSLPGNSALAVAVGRYMPTGAVRVNGWHFSDWDLDVPRIRGVFPKLTGWRVSGAADVQGKRCSLFGQELLPVRLPSGSLHDPGFPQVEMRIPGGGAQELLIRSPSYATAPSTGGPYPVLTKAGWQFECLPSLAGGADPVGEGFLARAPDGTTYRFDWSAVRDAASLQAASGGAPAARDETDSIRALQESAPNAGSASSTVARVEVWLLPTLVTDRFGNTVTYTYAADKPWQLTRIQANDGRTLTLSYADGTRVSSVSDGTRTWLYQYGANSWGLPELSTVVLPDQSTWQFSGHPLAVSPQGTITSKWCGSLTSQGAQAAVTRTMKHPSGAIGQFTLGQQSHVRSFVDCPYGYGPAINFHTMSLTRKSISGPGLPEMVWTYAYPAALGGPNPCTACSTTKEVVVTDPSGARSRHVLGIRWRDNEGMLLQMDEGWNGTTALRTTRYGYRSPLAGPYPAEFGYSHNTRGDGGVMAANRPQDRREITQQGRQFVWEATDYDVEARATRVVRTGPSGARAERTGYWDNLARWVMGQTFWVQDEATGLLPEQHAYTADTAVREQSRAFGWRTGKWDYHPDGTLKTAYDAADRPTSYTHYKRGLAQNIGYPDGTGESVGVDDLGLVRWHTNAAGTTTWYGYDGMGRLARIDYPAGDAASYHPTLLSFTQSGGAAMGLAAGHWQQVVTTGNRRTENYFDALWRLRLTRTWDVTDAANTGSAVETRYDFEGRKTFESYKQRTISAVDGALPGTAWTYDDLDRVTRQTADSELGLQHTVTEYLDNFQRRVTNPRGFATTTAFQAFDTPSEERIAALWAPEGVSVSIERDGFGKALSITRAGGGKALTRSYRYDGYQRLCKTVEPEAGATVQGYDNAGNLQWKASGQNLPGPGCETTVAGSQKVNFGYDARNRLTSAVYGDGSQSIQRTYTPDGLLASIVASHPTHPIAWLYTYNNRRLLTREQYTWWGMPAGPTEGWVFQWDIDAHGNVAGLTDPWPWWGTMAYAPNALGQPTRVGNYATGVRHHPNGAVASYTNANGVVRTVSQNLRGMPELWRDSGPAGLVTQERYAYDGNGNVTSITDERDASGTRTMPWYDGLDRLRQANGPWGAGSFGYDALDNLVSSTVGTRSLAHNIDANNRLVSLTGTQNIGIGYDANGNITSRGSQGFVFDIGNRMTSATGKASYAYDGHGRRNMVWFAGGSDYMHQAYTQDGKLRLAWRLSEEGRRHVYLGDQVIAEHTRDGVFHLHADALGSPVAKTNSTGAVVSRTRYEPYGATVEGTTNPTGIGFTGHVNDVDTGLVYMQQRYYDSLAGRFLSVDPVPAARSKGLGPSRFGYSRNNPYRYVDPDGRWPTWVHFRITYNAGIKAGLSENEAKKLAGLVRDVDIGTQCESQRCTVLHAMAGRKESGGYQTREEAEAGVAALIRNPESRIRYVLHVLQDKGSPSHNYEEWHNPLEPDPEEKGKSKDLVTLIREFFGVIGHILGELFIPEEVERELTEQTKEMILSRPEQVKKELDEVK